MKRSFLFVSTIAFGVLLFVFSLTSCSENTTVVKTPVDYVNPTIGNISHLLVPTYPTTQLPNSMLRIYPKRENYAADLLAGLPVAVVGHRATSAFRLDPMSSFEGLDDGVLKGLSYINERVTPYSYAVHLDEMNVDVMYAPARKSAVYDLVFKEGNANLAFTTVNGSLELDGNVLKASQKVGDATIYLYMEMEQMPIKRVDLETTEDIKGWTSASAYIGAKEGLKTMALSYDTEVLNLRYGISYIDVEQAKKNLYEEIEHYDVSALAEAGKNAWNDVLEKIQVDGSDENAKVIFYTALYRTYERMIDITEDGRYYSAFDKQVHQADGTPYYTDDWIWDTYRAVHPLRLLIEPEMEEYMVQSFVRAAQQSADGWLPTFPEVYGDGCAMNGNHAIATIWDAYVKGVQGFDFEAAYQAAKKTLDEKSIIPWRRVPRTELDDVYHTKGFFPALQPGEKENVKEVDGFERRQAVAITLADCYDSWCLAQMAKELGYKDDYENYIRRSRNYRNIYNEQTGFFHPKNKDGKFIEPFDYVFSGGPGNRDYYDENNGWIYRWDLPHDVYDLINLMGGQENFVANLDQTFREPLGKGRPEFYAQNADHTGNVGQFSMGNEPSLHIPYLYCYGGEAWKTQKRVRTLLNLWFRNDLMGVPGDEDGGGLSSFVVFSMLGFYPVCPGTPVYVIGSPVFEEASVQVGPGKTFTVKCRNYSPDHHYIQSATLNGEAWNKPWIHHEDVVKGGELEFVMGAYPNKDWASNAGQIPTLDK